MAIKKGDPKDIATKGLLQPGDPISPATEGLIENDAGAVVFEYIASGGAVFSGVVLESIAVEALTVGGIISDGALIEAVAYAETADGGLITSGSVDIGTTRIYPATGSITTGGAADVSVFGIGFAKERGGKGTPGKKRYQRQNLVTTYKYLGGSRKPAVEIHGFAETVLTYQEPVYVIPPELVEHVEIEDFVEKYTDKFVNVEPVSYDYSSTGGIEFAKKSVITEAITKAKTFDYISSGGVEITSKAIYDTILIEPSIFDYVTSGGIVVTGESIVEDVIAEPVIFEHVSSGGFEIVSKTVVEYIDYELVVLKILDEEFLDIEISTNRIAMYLGEIVEEIINNPRSNFEYVASGSIKVSGRADIDNTDISYLYKLDEQYLKLDEDKTETNLYLSRIIEEINKKTPMTFEYIATGIVGIEGKSTIEHVDRTDEILAADEEFLLNYNLTEDSVISDYIITQKDKIEQEFTQNITQYIEDSILLYDMCEEKRSIIMEEVLNSIQHREIKTASDIDAEILAIYELF